MSQYFQEVYECDYCARTFSRKYNLRIHITNCHLNMSCYCDICDQTFGSPGGLQKHLLRGHNRFQKGYPECDICGRIFTRKQNITSHMITVHLQGSFPQIRCRYCEKSFTTDRNLKRHFNQLHNPYIQYPTCAHCFKVFKGKHSLAAHIQANHSNDKDVARCHLCDKKYTNNRNLKRHVEMFHGEKGEYRCRLCPKVYTSNQSLRRHSRTTHDPDSIAQTLKCHLCYKQFICERNLETHVQLFHSSQFMDETDYTYVCDHCEQAFEEEYTLRQHIKTEHPFNIFYDYCRQYLLKQESIKQESIKTSKSEMFQCEYCLQTFTVVYELKEHMKIKHDKEYALSTCYVCFTKFYCKDTLYSHKKKCIAPKNVHTCSHCDKLFTDVSSLEFHTRVFHPMAQIPDTSEVTSTYYDDTEPDITCATYKCSHCERVYYSDRSLKHHMKLKHTTDEAVECEFCQKICSNKYYLASHIKIVHSNDDLSRCDYCHKQFKSKRNIRRHIEYTHLGMQRYKCVECETLFKEKRSLRKHVRVKHPNSTAFPQCHICYKRFESAKSCKIHLKLVHSFNMNTHPCHLCSVSFTSFESLKIHLQTSHLAEDEIYKCEECNIVFKGQENFDSHNDTYHISIVPSVKQKVLPRCIICMKDFSTRKTLKRHIKKFHEDFDVDELANYGSRRRVFSIDCNECLKKFSDELYYNVYLRLKHLRDSVIFTCDYCSMSYSTMEYAIQRYKLLNEDDGREKMILSELCTAEMSDDSTGIDYGNEEMMEPESTTSDLKPISDLLANSEINTEDGDICYEEISAITYGYLKMKTEPMSP